jgi:site-specific DNA-methyltransferase (adenine-specific)
MEYLIKTYSNEGETVLDNCMGSGTTGVACKKTNRNFIGIEKDVEYFAQAKERIESMTVEEVAHNPLESAMEAI